MIFPRAWKEFFWVKILQVFDADPGWKKIGSGIRDQHPGSATLKKKIVKVITIIMIYKYYSP
jgi:hypothetical protein